MDKKLESEYIYWVKRLRIEDLHTEMQNIEWLIQNIKSEKTLENVLVKKEILKKEYETRNNKK
jgi:hypothetical protein